MSKITKISALEVLDSRGNWTVETSVTIDGQYLGVAMVPAGASVGSYEKKTLPAKTVLAAINGLLGPRLEKEDFEGLKQLDEFLISFDASEDRASLGANTMLSVSTAFCKALAVKSGEPLYHYINSTFGEKSKLGMPQPIFNIINGGKHAKNDLDFQEFIIIPRGNGTFESSLEQGTLIYHTLGEFLENNGFATELGDEGGFAPHNISFEGALNFIMEAGKKNQVEPGEKLLLGIDAAASSLAVGDLYNFERAGLKLDPAKLQDLYLDLLNRYPIIYLEDPFGQDNFADFKSLKEKVLGKVEIVGDDLIATNIKRLNTALEQNCLSGLIIKPNQIGTLTETFEVINLARKNGISIVISHRSGETDDSFIADLAVGVGSKYIKAGAPARGERVAKYNRLLEIEKELNQ